VLAKHGAELHRIAEHCGVTLCYSAAVGGAVPTLEFVQQLAETDSLQNVRGVLNGTCNFVLDEVAAGATLDAAVRLAQEKGYAEEDPQLDLEGIDAAQKLILLARAAFELSLPLEAIDIKGIATLNVDILSQLQERKKTLRLVAECSRKDGFVQARVAPVELDITDHLAQVYGVENRLIVETEGGEPIIVSGTGAGRWPTAEAVMADLLEIRSNEQSKRGFAQELEECVA